MKYQEEPLYAEKYRSAYFRGIEQLIDKRYETARHDRETAWADFPAHLEEHRRRVVELLGWPLCEYRHEIPEVKCELLSDEETYRLYRMTVFALPDVPFCGLFFMQKEDSPRPLVVSLHGNEGTPELCSSVIGPSYNYNEMTQRLVRQGVHVYVPQTLMWNVSKYGAPYDRQKTDTMLKHLGGSIDSLEIYFIMKALDYLCTLSEVKPEAIGACGLSYGGFFSLLLMAIDTRICSAISSARFVDIDFEMERLKTRGNCVDIWYGSARELTLVELAMLCWPRKLFISMARGDSLVPYSLAEKACAELAGRTEGQTDVSFYEFLPFEGDHEFSWDETPINKMMSILNSQTY